MTLMANIEKVEEVEQVKQFFAEGVGLFRTEYLFLNASRDADRAGAVPGVQGRRARGWPRTR